jgi:ferritin-like metal-binding protein YciE
MIGSKEPEDGSVGSNLSHDGGCDMSIQSPQELLLHELHGIEDAESEASQALEDQMEEVENSQLRRLIERRLKQGERLQKEVQRNLEKLNGESRRENEAARGLIRDSQRLLEEVETPEMKEAVLIAGVQKLEHYCIAVWGTVRAMAEELGEEELARVMERAVEEGYELDEELTRLAESRINPSALESGEEAEDEEDEDEEEDEEDDEDDDEDEEESPSRQQAKSKSSQSRKSSGGEKQAKGRAGGADLKSREYRDESGEVHHHTRSSVERRGKK